MAKSEDDRLLVCGTNAYDPRCRYYSHNETHTSVDQEFSGKGFCPYDPRHNSTFLYTGMYYKKPTIVLKYNFLGNLDTTIYHVTLC